MGSIIKSNCRVCNYLNQFSFGGSRMNYLTNCSVPAIKKDTGEFVNINYYEHIGSQEYLFYHDGQLKNPHIDDNKYFNFFENADLKINKKDNYCPQCKNQTLDFDLSGLFS